VRPGPGGPHLQRPPDARRLLSVVGRLDRVPDWVAVFRPVLWRGARAALDRPCVPCATHKPARGGCSPP